MSCIIYISSSEEKNIQVWKIDKNINLNLIQIKKITGYGHAMTVSKKYKILYVGTRDCLNVINFKINEYGLIKKQSSIPLNVKPTHISFDDKNKILYISSYQNNCLIKYFVNNNFSIELKRLQILKGLYGCHSSNINYLSNNVWITCLKENSIKIYMLDTNKNLKKYKTIFLYNKKENIGPRHMVFSKKQYAYVINEINGTLCIINAKKNFEHVLNYRKILPINYINNKYWSSDVHITPNGKWLYCCDRNHNTISKFEILPEGNEIIFKKHYVTENQPRSFDIDDTGNFLVLLGELSNNMVVYYIDQSNGNLEIVNKKKVQNKPAWVSLFSL